MNRMKDVAHLLGVELGEKFIVKGYCNNPYYISEHGLCDKHGRVCGEISLIDLLTGISKIECTFFKPVNGEIYYSPCSYGFDNKIFVKKNVWQNTSVDYMNYKLELVFKTFKEAQELGVKRMKEIINECEKNCIG